MFIYSKQGVKQPISNRHVFSEPPKRFSSGKYARAKRRVSQRKKSFSMFNQTQPKSRSNILYILIIVFMLFWIAMFLVTFIYGCK